MTEPGPLIGRGRAADVYDVGGGRVLRRYRDGRTSEREFAVMRRLHDAGFPVPVVFDADGSDLVMERLEGRTMLDALGSSPWRVGALARQLAEIHRWLGAVTLDRDESDGVPDLPVRFADGGGDASLVITHFDLHPDNVMLTADGPVVFDWTNAAMAPPGTDVAMTWILMTSSDTDVSWWLRPIVGGVRRRLVSTFVSASGGLPDRALVRRVIEHRLGDPNVLLAEAVRLRAMLDS